MEKKAGVQRCGTWESSRDNFHLISHHQKLLHKIIVNYGGLLCIWFPTAATTAVTFLKIKCMFHLLAEREEGKKGKERKIYDGKATEISCAMAGSHSLCSGTSSRDMGLWQSEPELCVHPICISLLSLISSEGHCTKLIIPLSPPKQQHCQELCRNAMRAPHVSGERGWGRQGRGFFHSYTWNCSSELLLSLVWMPCPWAWCHCRAQHQPDSPTNASPSSTLALSTSKCWPEKPCGYLICRQILLAWKQRYFNHIFCVPSSPSASLSAN